MPLQSILEWNGLLFSATDAFQSTFGEIQVLKIVQMLEDGLADIEGLGTAGAAGPFFGGFFDGLGKAEGQPGGLPIKVYDRKVRVASTVFRFHREARPGPRGQAERAHHGAT